MNLLRKFFGERRSASEEVKNERRGSLFGRGKVVSDRLDGAIERLNHTVSMSRADFETMLESDKPKLVHDSPWNHVEFLSYSDNCQHLYRQDTSLGKLCRNQEHEAHDTGVASCSKALCPIGRKAMK